MKTQPINRRFFSANVNLTLPANWRQLTDSQLYYYAFLSMQYDSELAKALFLIRLLNIKVLQRVGVQWLCIVKGRKCLISSAELVSGLEQLKWMDRQIAVRPSVLYGFNAVHPLLQDGFTYFDYIRTETFFQQYIETEKVDSIQRMASFLYRNADGNYSSFKKFTETDRAVIILWWLGIKEHLCTMFPDLFRKAEGKNDSTPQKIMEANDAQIRALTGGDITKENEVLKQPCWRALAELNAKAREANELKKLYSNK